MFQCRISACYEHLHLCGWFQTSDGADTQPSAFNKSVQLQTADQSMAVEAQAIQAFLTKTHVQDNLPFLLFFQTKRMIW